MEPAILLLANGVDVNVRDNNGKKAIDYAKSNSMIRLLKASSRGSNHQNQALQ